MAGIFNPAIFNPAVFNTGDSPGPIFNKGIFNIGIFNTGDEDGIAPPVVVVTKTGTGGLDPGEGLKRRIVKPTGILHLPKKTRVDERVDDSRAIQSEIASRLAREFTEESVRLRPPPIIEMTQAEVDYEIGILMRKKMRTEEEELLLLLMMTAAAV